MTEEKPKAITTCCVQGLIETIAEQNVKGYG